ncbi:MAG: cell division protein FtsA, partial [Thermoflexibacteraceae bacterium]
TKDESAKSPMYATGVGLVLAGLKTMDDRQENYLRNAQFTPPTSTKQTGGSTSKTQQPQDGNILSMLWKKTQEFLTDDYDDRIN